MTVLPAISEGFRVYVRGEESMGTVVSIDAEWEHSAQVRMDSDGVVVGAALAQCLPAAQDTLVGYTSRVALDSTRTRQRETLSVCFERPDGSTYIIPGQVRS